MAKETENQSNKVDEAIKKYGPKVKAAANAAATKAKPYAQSAWQYAKENPGDVLLGLIGVMLWGIDDSLDEIEDSTNISAYVDASNYVDGGR